MSQQSQDTAPRATIPRTTAPQSEFAAIAAANGMLLSSERVRQLQPIWEGHVANVQALARFSEQLAGAEPAAVLRLPTRRQDLQEASVEQDA